MLWSLPLFPLVASLGLFVTGMRSTGGERRRRRRLAVASVGVAMVTAGLAGLATTVGWTGRLGWSDAMVLQLELTPFSALMALLVPLVAAPVLLYASFHEAERGLARLVALMTAFVGGMLLLVCAADLLTLLIGWELVGACSWALIAHHWRRRENPRHATVAFLVTRAGDLGLFAATGLAFAGTGSFAFDALASLHGTTLTLVVAGIVVAAATKSGQVPFAPWLFSAMAGPAAVSALLHSATMVAAGAFLLARLHPLLSQAPWFAPVVVAIGLATAMTGALVALFQTHAKRLLAASTSAHYGLMFVATGAGYPLVAMLHLVAHACFKAPMFLTTGILKRRTGGYHLAGAGLGPALPALAAAAAICALALGGVPPLGGAWTKEEVVTAAGHFGTWSAILVMVAAGLAAAYASRFWFQLFGFSATQRRPGKTSTAELVAVGSLAAVTLGLSLLWVPGVGEALAARLGGEIPPPKPWELALSITLLTVGAVSGWRIARRRPHLGDEPPAAGIAAWLGLPALAHHGIARPALAFARALAAFDDRVVDAPTRRLAMVGRGLAHVLGAGDRRVVDAGVRAGATFGIWLARLSDSFVELVVDHLPEGIARLTGASGARARRLQTGLAHHYYTLIVLGLAASLGLLFLLQQL